MIVFPCVPGIFARAWRAGAVVATAALPLFFAAFARAQAPGPAAAASGSASEASSSSASVSPPSASASSSSAPEPPAPPPAETVDCSACQATDAAEGGNLGLRYELETIRIRGNRRTYDRVILRYVPFRPGDEIDVDDPQLELVRFRLLGTGYFSDVQLSLSKGPKRGVVILNIDVIERNTIVVNDLWLGISADATPEGNSRPLTAFGGLDVAENNFYGTGISLGGALAVADRQYAYRLRFTDPSFLRSKWIVSASVLFNEARDFFGTRDVLYDPPPGETEHTDYAVAQYKRVGFDLSLGYDLTTTTRLRGAYHLERIVASFPRAASQLRGYDIEPIEFHLFDGKSLLSYLSLGLDDDTRDDPVLPSRGHWLQLGADLGLPTLGSDYSFIRFQGRGGQWWTLPWGNLGGHVLRLDVFGGSVFGNAPLFMRFYVGDLSDFLPDRVLDLNFDRRPPPNFLHTSVVEMRYEDLAFRINGEYRVPVYRGHRSIYGVDLFASAGFFAIASQRDISAPARGYSGFGRFPVDLTFNLGARISTSAGGFMLGLSNIIGFFPIRSGP
jgi:outer membrane protein insertion porin family